MKKANKATKAKKSKRDLASEVEYLKDILKDIQKWRDAGLIFASYDSELGEDAASACEALHDRIDEAVEKEHANLGDILPCPFCGGEGHLGSTFDCYNHVAVYYVKCSECCAETQEHGDIETAIDNWNMRIKPKKKGRRT